MMGKSMPRLPVFRYCHFISHFALIWLFTCSLATASVGQEASLAVLEDQIEGRLKKSDLVADPGTGIDEAKEKRDGESQQQEQSNSHAAVVVVEGLVLEEDSVTNEKLQVVSLDHSEQSQQTCDANSNPSPNPLPVSYGPLTSADGVVATSLVGTENSNNSGSNNDNDAMSDRYAARSDDGTLFVARGDDGINATSTASATSTAPTGGEERGNRETIDLSEGGNSSKQAGNRAFPTGMALIIATGSILMNR
jgi:hypothetical protein